MVFSMTAARRLGFIVLARERWVLRNGSVLKALFKGQVRTKITQILNKERKKIPTEWYTNYENLII